MRRSARAWIGISCLVLVLLIIALFAGFKLVEKNGFCLGKRASEVIDVGQMGPVSAADMTNADSRLTEDVEDREIYQMSNYQEEVQTNNNYVDPEYYAQSAGTNAAQTEASATGDEAVSGSSGPDLFPHVSMP